MVSLVVLPFIYEDKISNYILNFLILKSNLTRKFDSFSILLIFKTVTMSY